MTSSRDLSGLGGPGIGISWDAAQMALQNANVFGQSVVGGAGMSVGTQSTGVGAWQGMPAVMNSMTSNPVFPVQTVTGQQHFQMLEARHKMVTQQINALRQHAQELQIQEQLLSAALMNDMSNQQQSLINSAMFSQGAGQGINQFMGNSIWHGIGPPMHSTQVPSSPAVSSAHEASMLSLRNFGQQIFQSQSAEPGRPNIANFILDGRDTAVGRPAGLVPPFQALAAHPAGNVGGISQDSAYKSLTPSSAEGQDLTSSHVNTTNHSLAPNRHQPPQEGNSGSSATKRPRGRPKGVKDSRPRRRKLLPDSEDGDADGDSDDAATRAARPGPERTGSAGTGPDAAVYKRNADGDVGGKVGGEDGDRERPGGGERENRGNKA